MFDYIIYLVLTPLPNKRHPIWKLKLWGIENVSVLLQCICAKIYRCFYYWVEPQITLCVIWILLCNQPEVISYLVVYTNVIYSRLDVLWGTANTSRRLSSSGCSVMTGNTATANSIHLRIILVGLQWVLCRRHGLHTSTSKHSVKQLIKVSMWVRSFNISLGGAGNFIGWSFKNISHSRYTLYRVVEESLSDPSPIEDTCRRFVPLLLSCSHSHMISLWCDHNRRWSWWFSLLSAEIRWR